MTARTIWSAPGVQSIGGRHQVLASGCLPVQEE
jgi:hypothetical protein